MKLTMFVSKAGAEAARPGESINTLRLTLPPRSDKVDDANNDVFLGGTKSGIVELQGIYDSVLAAFKGGQRVVVTIEAAE